MTCQSEASDKVQPAKYKQYLLSKRFQKINAKFLTIIPLFMQKIECYV